jgi:catechol 2,3-dioxygenase-like lactoylglutathione lyase family enzyme
MIDHIYLPVSDLNRSSEFYKKVLEPRGIDMLYKFDQPPIRGFAINNIPGFWLKNGEVGKDLYVAFTAKSADAVRSSYNAAIDAGATANKDPSLRPEWRSRSIRDRTAVAQRSLVGGCGRHGWTDGDGV